MSLYFGRIITAMVTPFDQRGKVSYSTAADLTRYLIKNGSSGLVVSGTTGESPTLSTEEKLELFRVVSAAADKKARVIAGTGGNGTAASAALTEQASGTGIDGGMLVTPYYNKPTQQGLFEHFRTVAAATELPVMLYNVPGRTGVNMIAETTLRLAELDNIIAVKEASGNLEQAAQICKKAPKGFALYSGDDALTLPLLSIGAAGVVSVASNVVGLKLMRMVECFLQGDPHAAAKLHQDMLPLFKALFMETNPIPVKAALNLIGIPVGRPRLPLVSMKDEQISVLEQVLRRFELIT